MSETAHGKGVVVVVPTYQEADSLPETLTRLRAAVPAADVLVVDDASPDGTGALADDRAAADPAISVLHRAGKNGLGAAYRDGFEWALARDYDVVVEMDADGSHLPEELPRLLTALQEHDADLVIGSRWVDGGEVLNWPWYRKAISRGGTWYARLMMTLPVHDATAGYRAFRAEALRTVRYGDVASQGYCFQIDMTHRVHAAGLRLAEVPVTFVERVAGSSKMSGAIVREALWRVTWWGLALRWRRLRSLLGRG